MSLRPAGRCRVALREFQLGCDVPDTFVAHHLGTGEFVVADISVSASILVISVAPVVAGRIVVVRRHGDFALILTTRHLRQTLLRWCGSLIGGVSLGRFGVPSCFLVSKRS